ncbi:MAG TPA: MobF family relaxase [Acidimicrobiales bacterium]|nr:MobF family relaxase [Acidimicrobiales bacterium]
MRFSVTPLGGARGDLARVVDGIVRYLQPPPTAPAGGSGTRAPTADGPSRYYADSGEEPGRWLGRAAEEANLTGEVRPGDFAAVLAGRDPHTGERLITAQGSAGRRPDLGVGNATRRDPSGELLFGEADVAAALGMTRAEVARLLEAGAVVQAREADHEGRANGREDGRVSASEQVSGSHLRHRTDPDGSRWVALNELTRVEAEFATGVDPESVRASGNDDDQLPIDEAARLAGTTTRYLRNLAKRYEDHRQEIERTLDAGRRPRKAYLVAHRGTRNQWLVTRGNLADFLERRHPPAVRVGYDLTLTTEKSLGVLALLGDAPTSRQVLQAIQDSNDLALGWLEERAAFGRVTGSSTKAQGWTVASFRHLTSRALDPFPHHHNVIANSVTMPDGSRRGLDARGLYRHAQAASALATAEMRFQLSRQLGVRWRPGRKSGWEIDGISDQILTEFSMRRTEIDDALRELEEEIGRGAHPDEIEHIVLRTRPAKNHTPAATLVDGWRDRAATRGLDADAIRQICGIVELASPPATEEIFTSLAAPDGICTGGSVFTRSEALVALVNHPVSSSPERPSQPLLVGAAAVEVLVDRFLTSDHVVEVSSGDEPLYTTVEMLGVQEQIARRFSLGFDRGHCIASEAAVRKAQASAPFLSDEQRSMVSAWCTQGHRFQAAIGRAGTGKTTTVAVAAAAWEAQGFRVVGTAVKGEAARTLAAATGIECETVAWYLAHDDPEDLPLDATTILVIDEASTLADRDLDAIMTMATRSGAALRLIGDPAQHGAIAAGGMFRVLCERNATRTPELTTTYRMKDPSDRAAAEALREGRIDDALDHLEAAGHLHLASDDLAMYRQVLGRWWDAHLAGLDHPMVDRRNSTRRQLNRLAHELRRVHGEVGDQEVIASGDRRFSVGDRVTARAPARHLHVADDRHAYVRNGALGTVTAIGSQPDSHADVLTVDFDGIGPIDLPRQFFDHHRGTGGHMEVGIDHAYALTSYAVQGSTREVSTSRVDATTTRAETYVDITRGRQANHLYLTTATDALDGEALPRVPAAPADEAIAHRLAQSTAELTAWELAHPPNEGPSQRGRAIGF